MRCFIVMLVLGVTLHKSQGYALNPVLEWPSEYHFNGEEINLASGILKPFEIWYSQEQNRSRIDLYNGNVRTYYYTSGLKEEEGNFSYLINYSYKIYSVVSEDDVNVTLKCDEEMTPTFSSESKDFLPNLDAFVYSGKTLHKGKQVQEWKSSETMMEVLRVEETILIDEVEDGIGIPIRRQKKSFNMKDGSLMKNTDTNYYNFWGNIPEHILTVDENLQCSDDVDDYHDDLDDITQGLHPMIRSDVEKAFRQFKQYHGRDYVDEEHNLRMEIFRHNWEFILDHNSQGHGYELGLNQFADKAMHELEYLNGVQKSEEAAKGTHPFPYSDEEDLPREFDQRDLGIVSPVHNQEECGSCWAWAATTSVEGALARANGGKLIDLSEQSLVDCAWAYRNYGCKGTLAVKNVYNYLMKHGIPKVSDYGPYLAEDGICHIQNISTLYQIKGFVSVTPSSTNALKAAVFHNGPVSVAIDTSTPMFFYKSGVFYDKLCVPKVQTHMVTVVGYGYRHNSLYWIIKNSWGEGWGSSGYMLLSATDNNCNVLQTAYYPLL